mgnify:CR=1 FL=1
MSIIDEVLHYVSYYTLSENLYSNELDDAYEMLFAPTPRGRAERRRQKTRRYVRLLREIQSKWQTDLNDAEEVKWTESWARAQLSGSPWYHRRYDDSERWKRFGPPNQRWPYNNRVRIQLRKFEQEFYYAGKEVEDESGDSSEHLLAQSTGEMDWRSQ